MSRDEFERRYAAMPNVKKAELIEGIVYMPSPVRHRGHSEPHSNLITWLGNYRSATPGVLGGNNGTIRLDLDNEPQPDAYLLLDPRCGGQARISTDDYIEGAPELVAEVSGSSVSFDLHTKKNVYRRNGVREYLVWRALEREIDWFSLRGSEFVKLVPDGSGVIRSEVFPGLWLSSSDMIRGDLAAVLAVLQNGLASPEHAAFLQKLGQ